MAIVDWGVKIVIWSWLTVAGISIADLAIELQQTTIKAYQKGPISAKAFTRMLTEKKQEGSR